jgi:hypothetical protein
MKKNKSLLAALILTFVTVVSTHAQNWITNGLVAYYPFNGNANNAAGSGFVGTVNGAQASSDRFGNPNSAYRFNGTGNYIYVSDQLPDSQEFTFSAWLESEEDKYAGIFYEAAYFTPGRDTILETFPGGELHGTATKIADPGPNSLVASGVISTGAWTHVVWVLRTNGTAIYVNGIASASNNYPGNNIGYHSPMYIGAENHGAQVEYFFHGSIDDVRVYNRALSASEASQLYAIESGFCSPHAAQAVAVLTNGLVVGATITDAGCGYTNVPLVLIEGGGGTGATATAVINNGVVVGINITSAGCCYTNAPDIEIASPPFVPTLSINVSKVKVTQHVVLGRNYVLESSSNLANWTATGSSFTATNESITSEFDVNVTGRYFRIRQVP